ncbi:MAG: ABC transporter ATP-binding protein [Alphaproteobacteria bacterium]
MTTLELTGVSRHFGDRVAVDGADLAVDAGELVCLLGPSGCGKSTLLRIAAGLEIPDAGTVAIDGAIVADARGGRPPEDRNVGMVFQDYALFPHMTVADNVAFGLRATARAARHDAVDGLLRKMGMADAGGLYPHVLSGGQQQRIALARALAPKPRIMLLDEPFSGLDRGLRDAVRDETLHMLKGSGAACVLVTHDPEEAMFMGDRIALMRDGRIVQDGPPDTLYYHPASAFAAGFLGEANRLLTRVAGGRPDLPFALPRVEGVDEGRPIEVIIRPEALRLTPGPVPDEPTARVMAARFLGRTSLIHLALDDGTVRYHLHARMPGRYLPREGAPVGVHIDPKLAFVFPAAD